MAAINTDKETAVAVMAELVKVGVAFNYKDNTNVGDHPARWSQRIEVDDSRTELLNVIWSIVTERRQREAHTQTTIARVARFGVGQTS